MEHNKKSNKSTIWIISIGGILIVAMIAWLAYHFIISKKAGTNEQSPIVSATPVIVPTDEPLITPKIVPSSKTSLKTFTFSNANSQYSFDYPSTWGLVEIAHDNIVRLNFAGRCRVEFSTLNNNARTNANAKIETRAYAGRTFQMTTTKINNSLYSETFTLNDASIKDGFSTVTADIPAAGISQCKGTVDQILTSLTFGQ